MCGRLSDGFLRCLQVERGQSDHLAGELLRQVKHRLALSSALLVTAVALPATAADTVTISTPQPFDRWCIKPLCVDPGAAPPALVVPPIYGDDTITGYAEERLRAVVAAEINAWIAKNAAEWNTKPIRDLARSAITAVLHKDDELKAAQGLGASLLRAGLTLRLEAALPVHSGCEGAPRRDAIYEGLGIARALGVLTFPEAKRQVLTACKPTALAAADAIDGTILRALDPGGELPKMIAAAKKLDGEVRRTIEAAKNLAPADPASASKTYAAIVKARANATIAAYVDVVLAAAADKQALDTWTEGPSAVFATEVKNLLATDVQPLETELGKTLASVDVKAFVDRASIDALACDGDACAAAKQLVLLARKGVTKETMRELIVEVRTRLGVKVSESSVFKGVIDALDAAVVSGAEVNAAVTAATIDGKKFVRDVLSRYCIDEDGHFSVTCAVAGKPEPLVLEANAGVPRLRSDDLRFTGDLTLGWKTKAIGVIGRGYLSYYDYTTPTGATDNMRTGGSLEAWYRSGDDSSKVRFEARLTGGVDYYDATYNPSGPAATSGHFHDEDSLLARGTLLVGVYLQPSAKFMLDLLVGGGGQYESYGYLKTDPADPNVLSDTTAVSGRGNGRLLMRWSFWPSILALRIRAEGSFFRLTRDVFTVAQIGRPLSAGTTSTEVTQVETSSRAFLDLDFAKLLGFVPAAWGGIDYFQISSDAGDTTISVPILGVGIVRPAF